MNLPAPVAAAPRALQRRLRVRAPHLAARVTWEIRRRRGEQALALAEALVRPGDVVLDVGANWGLFTARLSDLAGPRGQVHAFEPHPAHRRTLDGIARRRPGVVVVHPVALSDAPGEATLHIPIVDGRPVTALATLAGPPPAGAHERVQVPVRRLDDELAGLPKPVALVKCDVEGLERPVLAGAERTLRASLPALLIEIEQRHLADPIADTFAAIIDLGYEGYALVPGGLRELSEFDVERDQLRYLDGSPNPDGMPDAYVNDFLFLRPGTNAWGLLR